MRLLEKKGMDQLVIKAKIRILAELSQLLVSFAKRQGLGDWWLSALHSNEEVVCETGRNLFF